MIEKKLKQYTDLASEKIGGQVLYATDDFFAEKENLIKEGRGIFITDKYTDRGKWMDGWESRRKRTSGHDWVVLKLGAEGKIRGFDIDTNHFLGNHPPFASVEAIHLDNDISDWSNTDDLSWDRILPKSPLDPGSQHFFEIDSDNVYTHVRLHIYPDGGVARFRVYGDVYKDWSKVNPQEVMDLALVNNCGKALHCNDMFFSVMDNLISPTTGKNMGDGWETKRNRTPNNEDFVILKLGHQGIVHKVIIDTKHFKGNYPDSCAIDSCNCDNDDVILSNNHKWEPLLPQQKLEADTEHHFEKEVLQTQRAVTHVKLKIYPDGGISRLRILGTIK
ncbi:allantoicase [Flavobacteriales bacterium 33_180_T64]|nr:allantoicase [Flavobacteriales bacterium 33_180_T64]